MVPEFSNKSKALASVGVIALQVGITWLIFANGRSVRAGADIGAHGLFLLNLCLVFAGWAAVGAALGIPSLLLCVASLGVHSSVGEMLGKAVFLAVPAASAIAYRRRVSAMDHLKRRQRDDVDAQINDLNATKVNIQKRSGALQQRLHKFPALSHACQEMGANLEADQLFGVIVRESVGLTDGGEQALLFLTDDGEGRLRLRAAHPSLPEGQSPAALLCECDQFVFEKRRPYLSERTANEPFRFDGLPPGTTASFISAPLLIDDVEANRVRRKCIGVLRVNSAQPESFTRADMDLLVIIATLAGMAIQNAKLYGRCRELAITDTLTGLHSNHYFRLRFAEELNRAVRENSEVSVLMMDLDHFKAYNDQYGHPAGDRVLRRLSEILKGLREADDILGRYGGEEFIALLHCGPEAAAAHAERIRAAVEAEPFGQARLTISIGAASFPASGLEVSELIEKADGALYRAKVAGRNRVCRA
ncbi:MAG: sensor domain-containing diguanylate cyclase [Planctomycetes bacterium]|nr:sensor domain-containing diguanylate cyclase [Planctomycetota bacterium]MBM4083433.1 sensor domain-containing diguanylate cyclase [Planctomycetota bacterium]